MSPLLLSSPAFSVLVTFLAIALQESGCHGYQMSVPLNSHFEDRQVFRRDHSPHPRDSSLTKISSDLLSLADESSDADESQSASDEASLLDLPPARLSKRRKGPTLSVVNPLEILRQRLMLDMARRRMLENQQQIEANAALLEDIGKRSGSDRQRSEDSAGFQP